MNKYIVTLLIALGIAIAIPQAASAYYMPSYSNYGQSNWYGSNNSNYCGCGYNANYNSGYNTGYNGGYGYNPYVRYSYWTPVVNGTYMSPYQSMTRNILDAVVFDRLSRQYNTPSYSIQYKNDSRSNYNNRYVNTTTYAPVSNSVRVQPYIYNGSTGGSNGYDYNGTVTGASAYDYSGSTAKSSGYDYNGSATSGSYDYSGTIGGYSYDGAAN